MSATTLTTALPADAPLTRCLHLEEQIASSQKHRNAKTSENIITMLEEVLKLKQMMFGVTHSEVIMSRCSIHHHLCSMRKQSSRHPRSAIWHAWHTWRPKSSLRHLKFWRRVRRCASWATKPRPWPTIILPAITGSKRIFSKELGLGSWGFPCNTRRKPCSLSRPCQTSQPKQTHILTWQRY